MRAFVLMLAALPAIAALVPTAFVPAALAKPVVGQRPQAVADRYEPQPPDVTVADWVTGLDAPWSLVFLPDGQALVSERAGRIRRIVAGRLQPDAFTVPDVATGGERGLMGLALDPDYPKRPFLYAMQTTGGEGAQTNRVVRLRMDGPKLAFDRVILGGIPAGRYHDGGRIAFGPDRMLWIGTGDATHPANAQDPASLAGKLLRVTPDGAPAPGNPDPSSPVWSMGHRNIQGITWMPGVAAPLVSEHGPTGEFGLHAWDEINLARRGGNFGWPLAVGAPHRRDWVDPVVAWPKPATPPSGMTVWRGALMVATLRSEALVRIVLVRDRHGGMKVREIQRWFADGKGGSRFGRLRDAVTGPDGALYVLTNNRDGRGDPKPGDDRIIRITRRE